MFHYISGRLDSWDAVLLRRVSSLLHAPVLPSMPQDHTQLPLLFPGFRETGKLKNCFIFVLHFLLTGSVTVAVLELRYRQTDKYVYRYTQIHTKLHTHTMQSDFLAKAMETAKRATEEDTNGNYEQAYRLYCHCIETFMCAVKYERNEKIKASLRAKADEYLTRAEELQKAIGKGGLTGTTPGNSNTNRHPNTNTKKQKIADEETQKLQGALSQAILTEKPNVRWDDIAGLEGAKEALKEAVILPIKFPQLFTGKRTPWKGILLYGPPGTGKSYLAKAVATEAQATFFAISSADLVSKWLGESERLVRNLFEMAREQAPSIIFIDEIDSLCGQRGDGESESSRRIKTEFLVQMNGITHDEGKRVLVLGATNIPWAIDSAIRRRFEKRIYIPLPDVGSRAKMFKIHLGSTPNALKPADFRYLGELSDRMSGADISTAVREALMQPIRKVQSATHFKQCALSGDQDAGKVKWTPCSPGDPQAVEKHWMELAGDELVEPELVMADFIKAVQMTRPTVSDGDILKHQQFTDEFGQEG